MIIFDYIFDYIMIIYNYMNIMEYIDYNELSMIIMNYSDLQWIILIIMDYNELSMTIVNYNDYSGL